MSRSTSAVATTGSVLVVLGALVLFCAFFTVFLLVPFFIFLGGAVALAISELGHRRESSAPSENATPERGE